MARDPSLTAEPDQARTPIEPTAITSGPARTHRLGDPLPGRYVVFAVVSIGLLMTSIDQTIVATALPTLQRDLNAQVNWSSWTITIYALGQVLMMPMAGSLGELYGRKRVFLVAVTVFTVSSLACGLANDIYVLVALRGIQSLGGGALLPSATGIVSQQFGRDRDRALGLFSSIFPIGGVVGPVLGGVFVTYWSWRGIFLINVPIGLALVLLGWLKLPGGRTGGSARLDIAGVLLLAATLLPLMLGVAQLGGGSSWRDPLFVVPVVVGLTSAALFMRHASRAPAPFIPAQFLRGWVFGAMNLLNLLFGAAAFGFGALVPLYAEERYGIGSLAAGTLLTARAITMSVTAVLTVALLRRIGYRWPMAIGFVLIALGLVALAIPAVGSAYSWLSIGAGITGVGMGLAVPTSNNAALQLAPERAATIAGLRGMFRQTGGITGVAITSAILARSSDPGLTQAWIFAGFAVVLLLSIPLIRIVPEHRGGW